MEASGHPTSQRRDYTYLMARFVGLVGTGRGKAGNYVFSKGQDGSTIVRVYQPQVSNPRTAQQVAQRAKVALAGRISAGVASLLLVGLGGSRSENRSTFMRELLREAFIGQDGVSALINYSRVMLSQGDALPNVSVATPTITQVREGAQVAMTLTPLSAGGWRAGMMGRIAVIAVPTQGGAADGLPVVSASVDYVISAADVTAGTKGVQVIVPVEAAAAAYQYACYLIPMELSGEAYSRYAAAVAEDPDFEETNWILNVVSTRSSAVVYGRSRFITASA